MQSICCCPREARNTQIHPSPVSHGRPAKGASSLPSRYSETSLLHTPLIPTPALGWLAYRLACESIARLSSRLRTTATFLTISLPRSQRAAR